uniref:Lipoprotein n=1 Tax=Plectus sambesii TaxID=2011161 RepID=A0A914W9F6_9BILA
MAPLLLIAACDPMLNPLPACWEGRINNFALTVDKYTPSANIFGNELKDNEAYVFTFMFCISETTVCEKTIKISLSWEEFQYNGVEKFPFIYQVQGNDFFTIDSFFFGSDEQSSVNSAGYSSSGVSPAEYKKITFCDGTTFSMNWKNAFVPSPDMQKYLSNNNCGLCGNFDLNKINELETFIAMSGKKYIADDMYNLSDLYMTAE